MIDSILQGYNRNLGEGQIHIDESMHNNQGIKGLNKEVTQGCGISERMELQYIVWLSK